MIFSVQKEKTPSELNLVEKITHKTRDNVVLVVNRYDFGFTIETPVEYFGYFYTIKLRDDEFRFVNNNGYLLFLSDDFNTYYMVRNQIINNDINGFYLVVLNYFRERLLMSDTYLVSEKKELEN